MPVKRKVASGKIGTMIKRKNMVSDDEYVYDMSESQDQDVEQDQDQYQQELPYRPRRVAKPNKSEEIAAIVEKQLGAMYEKLEQKLQEQEKMRQERLEKSKEQRALARKAELEAMEQLILNGKRLTATQAQEKTKQGLKKTLRSARVSALLY